MIVIVAVLVASDEVPMKPSAEVCLQDDGVRGSGCDRERQRGGKTEDDQQAHLTTVFKTHLDSQ